VRVRLPDAESASDVQAQLDIEGIWIDDAAAESFDPGVLGFVIQNIVTLAGPFVGWLALQANKRKSNIAVEDERRRKVIDVQPGLTDEEITALAERLSKYGRPDTD
jgi:hypothetical protein